MGATKQFRRELLVRRLFRITVSLERGFVDKHESFFDDCNDSFDDGNHFFKDEGDNDDDIDCKEESINMDLDYDHLMAYFDNLKESSA